MALDWSNERYVRVYTRDTEDDLLLSWEATAVWHAVIRKVDRAGVLEAKRGAKSVALVTRIPLDVVERALPELLADGRLVEHELGYVIRNFIEAQETPQSDRQRAIESRARRRDRGRSEIPLVVDDCHETNAQVTDRDGAVTNRDASVTRCHAESRAVTSRHSDPSVPSVLSHAEERVSGKPDAPALSLVPLPAVPRPDPVAATAGLVIAELNRLTGKRFAPDSKPVIANVRTLLKAKHAAEDMLRVIRHKVERWKGDAKMREHLTPTTLLRPSNFERYLVELQGTAAREVPRHDPDADFRNSPDEVA